MKQFLQSCEEQGFTAYFINLRNHGLSDTPEKGTINLGHVTDYETHSSLQRC